MKNHFSDYYLYEYVFSEENRKKSFRKYLCVCVFFFFKYALLFFYLVLLITAGDENYSELFSSSDIIMKAEVFVFLKIALKCTLELLTGTTFDTLVIQVVFMQCLE